MCDLPEAEADGGLLGILAQTLYVTAYMATAGVRTQEARTRVREGTDRSAHWHGEAVSFICGDPRPSDEGIVTEVGTRFDSSGELTPRGTRATDCKVCYSPSTKHQHAHVSIRNKSTTAIDVVTEGAFARCFQRYVFSHNVFASSIVLIE